MDSEPLNPGFPKASSKLGQKKKKNVQVNPGWVGSSVLCNQKIPK